MSARAFALAALLLMSTAAFGQAPNVRLYAAGSLRVAMNEVAQAFTASGGPVVTATYGASGLLRERIEKGEPAEVFASADVGNPSMLARAGVAAPPVVFVRNRLCALVAPGVEATADTLLDRLLDPKIKLGTSTPKADPSGDYAWQLFEKAEKVHPGAYAILDAKALKLTGGPNTPAPPGDRSAYGLFIEQRAADIFLTYCTNALLAMHEAPGARMIAIVEPLAVGADYGLTTMNGASAGARQFAAFILTAPAQAILARYGFTPNAKP